MSVEGRDSVSRIERHYFNPDQFRKAVTENDEETIYAMLREVAKSVFFLYHFDFEPEYTTDEAINMVAANMMIALPKLDLTRNVFAFLTTAAHNHYVTLYRKCARTWDRKNLTVKTAQNYKAQLTFAVSNNNGGIDRLKFLEATNPEIQEVLLEGWNVVGVSSVINSAGYVTHYVALIPPANAPKTAPTTAEKEKGKKR